MLPDTLFNLYHHFTPRSQNISAIRTRTCLYAGYYLLSSIKLWNELPLEFRNITSPDIFKNRLKVINKKPPSYYYIGSRLAQVLHARLRMDSSSLNAHLFLRNLVDNPNCTCGQIETTAHFLLQCRHYSVIRDTTINSLNLLVLFTAKLLFYGSTALTDEQNTLIFTKVQKYILDSKRFVNAKYTETAFHPSSSFYFIFMYILFSSTFTIFIVNCVYYYVMFVQFFMTVLYVMMFSYCRFVRRRINISSACFRILVVYYILYYINMSYY